MMRIWTSLAVVCLASTPARADAGAEALAHAKAFEKAMNAGDVAAAVALYADDARVVFPGQGEEATGRAAIEKLLASTVEGFAGAPLTMEAQQVIPLAGGYTAVVGRWKIDFHDPDGSTQTVHLRSSEVLRKEGDRTVTVVDHKSIGVPPEPDVPADPAPPPPITPDGSARR